MVWPPIGNVQASAEGLWAGTATVVAPLARLEIPPAAASSRDGPTARRAAAEWTLGDGCMRAVGVGVPLAGDVTLQPAFMAVARALLGPCDGASVGAAAPDSIARPFARPGAAATAAALRAADESSPLALWLFVAALLVLAAELFVRGKAAETTA